MDHPDHAGTPPPRRRHQADFLGCFLLCLLLVIMAASLSLAFRYFVGLFRSGAPGN